MVWDSTLARNASTEVSLLESIVPHDRRESALRLFHENKYKINGKKNIIFITHFIIISLGTYWVPYHHSRNHVLKPEIAVVTN